MPDTTVSLLPKLTSKAIANLRVIHFTFAEAGRVDVAALQQDAQETSDKLGLIKRDGIAINAIVGMRIQRTGFRPKGKGVLSKWYARATPSCPCNIRT